MNALLVHALRQHLLTSLQEDGASLDWTGKATSKKGKNAKATIVAKANGIWCGSALGPAVEGLARDCGLSLSLKILKEDGTKVKVGDELVRWSGPADAIHLFERPFLNLASYLSGISTRTRQFVDLVGKNGPRVTATRKILPGYRDLALHAVLCGGGFSHRVNLAGGILIKENHIRSAGGIAKAIAAARAIAPHLLKVEIEVTNLTEVRAALKKKAEVIMLDNFTPAASKEAIALIRREAPGTLVEISGGISEETIRAYAVAGVDIISVGALTHSVTALDFSLLMGK